MRFTPTPVFDANAAGTGDLGDLPVWDLSDLYESPDAPELKRDMNWLEKACADFAADYEGKLAGLDAAAMLDCVLRYEKIDLIAGRIMSFIGLRYYQNTTDPERAKAISDAQDKVTAFTTPLVFFSLELNRIEDDKLDALFGDNADLARYKPIFDRMRAMRPYQLSDELEKFLHDQSTVGAAAWNRLFDETIAGLEFEVGGESRNLEGTLDFMTDRDRAKREEAARELANVFAGNVKIFARVHNTLAKEKEIEDRWRGMPTPQTGRHLSNHVEPEVVEALRNAVVAAYPKLSHRYYELKRKWMGLDVMEVWDRNAPLPMESDRKIGWDKAREMVLGAYGEFDPEMATLAKPFSTRAGSMRRPGRASHRARSHIRPCRARILMCCSTTRARFAT